MDMYDSLEQLKKAEQRSAWNQRALNRESWLTVVAPHGGSIESLTERIANDIAGTDYNLFVFEGLRAKGSELHVTSHKFRDPELHDLQKISTMSLSVHGKASDDKFIWVGGLNYIVRDKVIAQLVQHGFRAERGVYPYAGEHPGNFVNLTADHGVQLEISEAERGEMHDGRFTNSRYDAFVAAVRLALSDATLVPII